MTGSCLFSKPRTVTALLWSASFWKVNWRKTYIQNTTSGFFKLCLASVQVVISRILWLHMGGKIELVSFSFLGWNCCRYLNRLLSLREILFLEWWRMCPVNNPQVGVYGANPSGRVTRLNSLGHWRAQQCNKLSSNSCWSTHTDDRWGGFPSVWAAIAYEEPKKLVQISTLWILE